MSDRPFHKPLPRGDLDPVSLEEIVAERELRERLETRLALMPEHERVAVLVAIGFDEGTDGVAELLNLSPADARVLTDSGLQLLRGAFSDLTE